MRTIGLIGGMSWQSTLEYYRLINEGVQARMGGFHSAELVLYSVDFAAVERMQLEERWDDAGETLARAAASLERAGAAFLVLATNTMHQVADAVERAVSIPLLHIADATATEIARHGLRRVGLLGTRFTMERPFYRQRLAERHDLEVLVPGDEDRALVHRVIYDELCQGRIEEPSRAAFRRVIAELVARGAEGIVLGCTEIMLLVGGDRFAVPTFDTTALHAAAAVAAALAP
jgi:aspartate racemase